MIKQKNILYQYNQWICMEYKTKKSVSLMYYNKPHYTLNKPSELKNEIRNI